MSSKLSNRFSRALEITKMMAKLGLQEVRSGSLQSRIEQAKILTESLSQLKGAAMKAGQLLSLDLEDYFPPEALKILAQLQNSIADTPDINIKKTLLSAFGEEKFQKLSEIQSKPFAAASMGQVYRATLTADDVKHAVAFKVLYPGVAESVSSDVALLQKAVWAFCKMTGRQMDLDPVFAEIESVLKSEVDFVQEKNSTVAFQKLFSQHTWKYLEIKTPHVFESYSTHGILCTSFEDGLTLKDWIEKKPAKDKKEKVALSLLELYTLEFFKWGLVQTDPNPSNFIIRGLDKLEVIALDFGASKTYSYEFRKAYTGLLKTIRSGSDDDIIKRSIDFGLIDARESKETLELFIQLLKHGIKPFSQNKKFQFSDDTFLKENGLLARTLLQKLKFSAPPHQLLFLHRKLGGVYAILRKLEVEIEVSDFWNSIENNKI
ncbi:MAG: AarF/UbiB family protein [Bdellovibrionota bacterium]